MCEKLNYRYSDVHLIPNFSSLPSGEDASTKQSLGKMSFDLPVIPANMVTVIDERIAKYMSENGYMYIMHRFFDDPYKSILEFVHKANSENWKNISISIGVKHHSWINMLTFCRDLGYRIDYITIDVAHGHHSLVRDFCKRIKEICPNSFLIVGNIATVSAVRDLQDWGADAIKVGIAGGQICSTYNQTGFHVPMFSCIKDCANISKVPIIADGSVKEIGDIAKALVAGASMVMCGKLFASCSDSPAEIQDGQKIYYGSTSIEAKKVKKNIEGHMIRVNVECTYAERLKEIKEALQHSISYGGGSDLSAFDHVRYGFFNRN